MAELRGTEIFDGVKIAEVLREKNQFAKDGFVLCIVPVGERAWKKYMGQSADLEYIGAMYACSICSGCAEANYFEPIKSRLLAKRICFGCDHWQQIIAHDEGTGKEIAVVVGGKHYQMGKNTAKPHRYSGFGGDVFNIRFFDGRTATCNNLWFQGDIPERWRAQLPDNAEFVSANNRIDSAAKTP